jgi:hypothetical protein
MMEAVWSSETSVLTTATRRHIPVHSIVPMLICYTGTESEQTPLSLGFIYEVVCHEGVRLKRRYTCAILDLGNTDERWASRSGRFTSGQNLQYLLSMRLGGLDAIIVPAAIMQPTALTTELFWDISACEVSFKCVKMALNLSRN